MNQPFFLFLKLGLVVHNTDHVRLRQLLTYCCVADVSTLMLSVIVVVNGAKGETEDSFLYYIPGTYYPVIHTVFVVEMLKEKHYWCGALFFPVSVALQPMHTAVVPPSRHSPG